MYLFCYASRLEAMTRLFQFAICTVIMLGRVAKAGRTHHAVASDWNYAVTSFGDY